MLKALLLCEDQDSVRTVTRSFKELGVEVDTCSTLAMAMSALGRERFDAILADDEVQGYATLLSHARETPACEKSVRIVLARAFTATDGGTQVVLYKPLSGDRVRHGLRAVRNLMARERRTGSKRVRVDITARLVTSRGTNLPATLEDLSETGAALRCEGLRHGPERITLEWSLPESQFALKATAEQVWRQDDGLCGIRFLDISAAARKMLVEWLRTRTAATSDRALAARN